MSAEAAALLERARMLTPLIAEQADAIEQTRRLTPPVVAALIEGGFYRLLLPKSLGGAECAPAAMLDILEEIARADASTAWCVGQCAVSSMVAAYLDHDIAAEIFNTPPGILAWGAAAGEARAVTGGYRVTRRWSFASGCRQASWLGAHVQIVEADGKRRMLADGRPAQRTILFPLASATLHDVWQVIGLNGTGTDDYAVEDLFVPERYTARRDDPTARLEPGPLYKLTTSMMYGLCFASVALGVARASLDAVIATAQTKTSRDVKHAMAHNHAVQSKIGRSEARLRAARAYLHGALAEVWSDLSGAPDPEAGTLTGAHRLSLRLASTWAIHEAAKVVDTAYHMAGATAVFRANAFERRFRDVHAIAQQIQARDIHYESVGQVLLGLEPEAAVFAT